MTDLTKRCGESPLIRQPLFDDKTLPHQISLAPRSDSLILFSLDLMKREILFTLVFWGIFCFRITAETPPTDIVEAADHQRYSVSAYQAGCREAWRDLHENRLIIEEHGLPPPCWDDYKKLLEQRYHVQVRMVGGCVVDEKVVGHEKGYNQISKAEIEQRFGKDVLEKALAEAAETFRTKRSAQGGLTNR
jgi:hypothetical protein